MRLRLWVKVCQKVYMPGPECSSGLFCDLLGNARVGPREFSDV